MGRGHWHPSACKACGKIGSASERISQRGYCMECAIHRSVTQITSMVTFSGNDFQEWRRAVARSVGAVLPEDQT